MRRLLVLFLAVLLPLQFAWGAVAGYCQHETGVRSHHFGHHEHVHKAEAKKSAEGKLGADQDCGTCHAAGASALVGARPATDTPVATARPVADPPHAPPSLAPKAPYRPNWPRPA